MAFVNADFVKESTTTTGTGTLSLAGAESGFRTFVAGIGNGNTCLYTIQASNGSWESGVGTVTDGTPDTLARTTLIASTTGAKLDLPSGTHYVMCAPSSAYYNQLEAVQLALSNDDTAVVVGTRTNRVRIPFAHEITAVAISCDASSKGSATANFNAHSINTSTGASTSILTGDIALTSSDQYVAGTLSGTITGAAGAEYGFSCSQASTAKGVMGHLIIKRI
jgi:hypothetical protein